MIHFRNPVQWITPKVKWVILLLLLIIPIFGHLDTIPFRVWDEARVAVNAFEMSINGNYLIPHFDGAPDMWNTKPPLLIWFQMLFIKTLGFSELALRMPSAIAAFLTCTTVFFFVRRYLSSFWFGFITALILVTSSGFIGVHSSRTCDYESLLTLFTTLSGLFLFAFLLKKSQRLLYAFFITLALACLTKGVSGLLFTPGMLLYLLFTKELLPLLKNKHFYAGLGLLIFVVAGYYLFRDAYNPGYVNAVYENELGGRYLNVIEQHTHSNWYYFDNLTINRMNMWYLLIPTGVLIGFLSKDEKIKRITLFFTVMVLSYFTVITISKTKLAWYDVPLYPYLSFICAIALYQAYLFFKESTWFRYHLTYNIWPFLFLFFAFLKPYQTILDSTYKPVETVGSMEFYAMGYYLKDAVNGKNNPDDHLMVYEGYSTQNDIYLKMLGSKNINVSKVDWKTLHSGDKLIVSQEWIKDSIQSNYSISRIDENEFISKFLIHGEK